MNLITGSYSEQWDQKKLGVWSGGFGICPIRTSAMPGRSDWAELLLRGEQKVISNRIYSTDPVESIHKTPQRMSTPRAPSCLLAWLYRDDCEAPLEKSFGRGITGSEDMTVAVCKSESGRCMHLRKLPQVTDHFLFARQG